MVPLDGFSGIGGTGGVCVRHCLGLRQLSADALVAVVDTLRTLELLNRVNTVELPALDVVDIELRQLLDVIELAPGVARPLRVVVGDTGR